MKKQLLIVLLLCVFCYSQISMADPRIINGDKVLPGNAKWKSIVALADYPVVSSDYNFCGGTLIGAEWVLTAAHCVSEYGVIRPANETFIYYDTYHIGGGQGRSAAVEEIIPHPSYDEDTMDNDIALLKLSSPVSDIEVIHLRTSDPIVSTPAWVAGWGNTVTSGTPVYPEDLMEADVPIYDFSICNDSYTNPSDPSYPSQPLTSNMFCAGYLKSNKDSCQGDSGGPLIIQNNGGYELAGVVSFGNGCAEDLFPGVYTKVNNYLAWIADVTRKVDNGFSWILFVPVITGGNR